MQARGGTPSTAAASAAAASAAAGAAGAAVHSARRPSPVNKRQPRQDRHDQLIGQKRRGHARRQGPTAQGSPEKTNIVASATGCRLTPTSDAEAEPTALVPPGGGKPLGWLLRQAPLAPGTAAQQAGPASLSVGQEGPEWRCTWRRANGLVSYCLIPKGSGCLLCPWGAPPNCSTQPPSPWTRRHCIHTFWAATPPTRAGN